MAEIDPVVLELRANLLRYQSDLRKQATDTERQLGRHGYRPGHQTRDAQQPAADPQ